MRKTFGCVFAMAICALAALFVGANVAWAQEVTATITGTVADSTGAAVVGATVTAKSVERGISYTAISNESGLYRISQLPVGNYDLKVEKPGFQTTLRPAFALVLNQVARIDVELKVGQVSQTIEVTGTPPLLKTESTQVDTIIDASTNEQLPLATRNYVQLTLLAPGSITTNPSGFNNGDNVNSGERPYINGNREQSNNFLLDGMDNNEVSDNLLGYTPAPDAIEEFNLITNNAPAEFGNFQGGIVSATIKSGTNAFHGDAWEFFRNDILNANSWSNNFSGTPRDKLRWNMFGATFGGPAIKNKLFFFADYQGQRFDHPSSSSAFNAFTPAEQGGNFSQLLAGAAPIQLYNPCQGTTGQNGTACVAATTRSPFPGDVIPASMISPVAKALFASSLFPKTVNNALRLNAINTTVSKLDSNQGDIKIDYSISNNDRVSGRFTRAYQTDPSLNSQLLFGNGYVTAPVWNTVGDWTRLIHPNLVNDARFGWSHITLNTGSTFDQSVGAFGNTIGIGNGNPTGLTGLLGLGFGNIVSGLGSSLVTQNFDSKVWQAEDSISYTVGRHSFKLGGQYWRDIITVFYSGNNGELGFMNFAANFTASAPAATDGSGEGMADFFLGLPTEYGRGLSTGRTWKQSSNIFAGYGQDTWRLTDRLTVNLGLRYEAHTPWVEASNQQVNYDTVTQQIVYAGQNGSSGALYKGFYGGKDFQPRLGFAWTPSRFGGRTVLRGAFTISSYLEGTGTNLRLPINPPFNPAEIDVPYKGASFSLPSTTASAGIVAPPPPPAGCPNYSCFAGAQLRIWDPDVQPAISDQWNLTAQQQFWGNTTFQLGYVGQRGTHLMVPFDYAQRVLQPNGTTTISPYFTNNAALAKVMSVYSSGTQSNGNMMYNALQAVLKKQVSNGLQYQVAYTYSKCMTNNSGYYGSWGAQADTASPYWQNTWNPKAEWAPCYYDSTNILSGFAIYDLPVGEGRTYGKNMNKVANAIVGGWTVSPIISTYSGFPLAPYGNDNSGTNSRGGRPDCNAIVPVQGRIAAAPGLGGGYQWFVNSNNAFTNPAAGTFGSCPASLGWLRGPGYFQTDLGLMKNIQMTERFKLQFRSDFLNTFNNVNLNAPNTSVGSGMGLIQSAQSPRNIQFALKLYY
jgi:Carboxypeptidase regulatory-like domain